MSARLHRWRYVVMSYQFQIVYKSGKSNVVADALSRIQIDSNDDKENECKKFDYDMLKMGRGTIKIQTRAQREKEREQELEREKETGIDEQIEESEILKDLKQKPPDEPRKIQFIRERMNIVLKSKEYDYIFYVIHKPGDILHRKLQHKLKKLIELQDIEVNKLFSLGTDKSVVVNPSQFRTENELNSARILAETIFSFCNEKGFENIAINIQFQDSISHFEFKNILYETFKFSTIWLTLHLNEIIEVSSLEIIDKILYMYHDSLFGAHNGTERMKQNIKRFYHWPNMNDDIKKHISNCAVCEKTKITTHTKSPMVISTIATTPFQKLYVDIVGPINPVSEKGNAYILTCNCSLTKYVVAVPMADFTAFTTAKNLVHSVFLKYGLPEILVTDNGTNFISETMKEVNKLFKIKKIFTTPYHPQSNQIERFHRTLGNYMKAFVQKEQSMWCEYIDFAVFAYNSSYNISTGFSPFELVFGRQVKLPTEITNRTVPAYNYENYSHELRRKLKFYYDLAKENLLKAKEINKKAYDKRRDDKILQLRKNDLVLVLNPNKKGKFDTPYEGPFRVIREQGPVTVIIQRKKKEVKIHKDRIKLAEADYERSAPPLIE